VALKGLAALRQKVAAPVDEAAATVVRVKPVPWSQVERVNRIKAAVDAVLPIGAESYIEYSRLYIGRHPFWEVVVDPDCKVAVLTSHTRKANSQGLTDAQVVEAVKDYTVAMAECEMVVEVVIRAKGAE